MEGFNGIFQIHREARGSTRPPDKIYCQFCFDAILGIGFINNFSFHCLPPLPCFGKDWRRNTLFLNGSN